MPNLNLAPTRLLVVPLLLALPACNTDPPATSDSASTTMEPEPATSTGADLTTTGLVLLCKPGQERCADDFTREVCKPTGLDWEAIACAKHQKCSEQGGETPTASCLGPCEAIAEVETSVGCEFIGLRVRSGNGDEDVAEFYDALIVGNPDDETAEVQLYFTPDGSNQEAPLDEPVQLPKGESHIFKVTSSTISGFSTVRNGGIYRIKSDIPVVAYLHSPLKNSNSNDASMLLPLRTLRQDYVVASYPAQVNVNDLKAYSGRPSFFNVIALENGTTIDWTPRNDAAGNGLSVDPVAAGQTGRVKINKFDVIQVGAATLTNLDFETHDISGTVIHADKPVWVLGGTACAKVPFTAAKYCNHLQEQMIPIEYWGKNYAAPHSPLRATERHYWRVYAGEPGITVTVDPAQPGIPPLSFTEVGQFKDVIVENGKSFTFQGTGAFMPVQYLASHSEAGNNGDPAMYQMIPVEQYLNRYAFVTGVDYTSEYAQIIRVKGSAPVKVNGEEIPQESYYLINSVNALRFEVTDYKLESGPEPKVYFVESDDPFGVMVVGYTGSGGGGGSAYAYPGGMQLKEIGPK